MEAAFYKEGYELALENSKILSKNSELIASNGDFGLACSLNILSSEEALKSIYIMLKYFHPNYDIDDFEKVFRDHKHKHEQLESILIVYDSAMINMKTMFFEFDKIFKIYDDVKSNLSEEKKIFFEEMLTFKQRYSNYSSENIENIRQWLKQANNEKNSGLYVGIKKNKWWSPKNFNEKKFIDEHNYTNKIITMAEEFELMNIQLNNVKANRL